MVLTPMMVEVALTINIEEVAPTLTICKRGPTCPWNCLIRTVGEEEALVCSTVSFAPLRVVVPMVTTSAVDCNSTNVPESCQPEVLAPPQMLLPEVQTLCPPSARIFPATVRFPPKVEVEFVPFTLINPVKVEVA